MLANSLVGARWLVWVVGLAVILTFACDGGSERAPEEAPTAGVESGVANLEGMPQIQRRQDGALEKAPGGEIDIDFPEDFPIYPGAKLVSAEDGKGKGVSLEFETPDAAPSVAAGLSDALEKEGWFVQQTRTDDTEILFAKKESRDIAFFIVLGDTRTAISVLIAHE